MFQVRAYFTIVRTELAQFAEATAEAKKSSHEGELKDPVFAGSEGGPAGGGGQADDRDQSGRHRGRAGDSSDANLEESRIPRTISLGAQRRGAYPRRPHERHTTTTTASRQTARWLVEPHRYPADHGRPLRRRCRAEPSRAQAGSARIHAAAHAGSRSGAREASREPVREGAAFPAECAVVDAVRLSNALQVGFFYPAHENSQPTNAQPRGTMEPH